MCAGTTRTPASAKGSKVGDLMVEGTYIFDCEVFAYDWLFDFKDVVTGEHISIWNDNDAVIAFMERDPFLGGFNNKHYDNFILKAVMCGFTPEEVKKVNDLIIQEELSGWDIPSLKEYRVFFDSFDLRDDCQDGISLKAIEAHLGIPIEETGVDFNIDRPLTESERRRTEYYCRYDVDATEILWKLRQGYLDNKVAVGAKRGLTDRKAMYMTNAKLTSVYLQAEKPEKPWTDERNYQYPDKLLRQYIPQEIFDFFDRLHDPNVPDIDLFGGYDQHGKKIKGASIEFRIGDCVCTIAYGGIHGAIPNYVEVATENRSIRNKDVGSYYPHLMTIPLLAGQQYGFCSRNIPSPQIFVDMLEERMKAKKAGDKKTANALKLVANTSYGAMLNGKNGISYNDLYDPLMGRSVCITGQLLLLELSMHLVAECPTLKIIQLNTDGIMVSFDKSDEAKWQEITQEWQDRTGFELEEDFIQKIVQRDVNNYVEVPVGDGKPKVKGGNLVRGILTNANIDFTTMGFDLMWVANGDWEIVVENLTPMNFKEAFKLMKQGYPVKLPSWGGYWYWDAAKETIVMHTKDGKELDIRETKRVEYTTLNILSDEWVLASTKNCPAMGGEATFSFGEAIKYLKRGHKVARKGWNGKKQYIQLASGISYKAPTGDIVNCEHDAIGNMAVAFVGTSGVQMPQGREREYLSYQSVKILMTDLSIFHL